MVDSVLVALTNDQNLQRMQLELTLETTPRDSRYSNSLVNLMKCEEAAVRDGGNSLSSDITRRVDEALAQETHKFFAKTCAQNIKRWKALSQKLERERDKQRGILMEQISRAGKNVQPTAARKGGSLTPARKEMYTSDDLEDEALRLEEDYNRNFLQYEGFNLTEAFKSQAAKVDKDWAVHELALAEDYKTRRRQITGDDGSRDVVKTGAKQQDNDQENSRWQHPEKQKTLIHTAPVLVPIQNGSPQQPSAGSGIRAVRGRNSSADTSRNAKEVSDVSPSLPTIHSFASSLSILVTLFTFNYKTFSHL